MVPNGLCDLERGRQAAGFQGRTYCHQQYISFWSEAWLPIVHSSGNENAAPLFIYTTQVIVRRLTDMSANYRNPKANLFRVTAHDNKTESRPATAATADWNTGRKAHPLNQILPATKRWFDSLPASRRPIEMIKTYPRIANRIAFAWRDPQTARVVLDELLVDHRGGREGFPPFVMMELMRLRSILDGAHN